MSLTITNYKQLEGWAHDYKDLQIGEIIETETEYNFRVAYNSIPYTIKIFRNGTIAKEYEIVLRDGADITEFCRRWITKKNIEINKIIITFENLILECKPKATQINNPFYSNGPF
jgi:hypothetical protein